MVDEANVIDTATRAALAQKLAALEDKTTDQLVVVTLKSLQGTSIEDFGVQLGRAWKIGQKDKNNGVLLIVAPTERKVRIEVGYGLEGTLTDAVTRLIIENSIVPRFRANDVPGGIVRGIDDIIDVLTGDPEEWKRRAAKRPEAADWVTILLGLWIFGISLAIPIGIMGGFFMLMRRALKRIKSPGGRHSGSFGTSDWSSSSGSSDWSGSSSSSGSSGGSYSGGGGSFGGGGSSGSW